MAADAFRTFGDRLAGSVDTMIDGLFGELAAWADKPRWAGSGFTRLVIELADLPGHPARLIARRCESMLEAQFADRLAKAGVAPARVTHVQLTEGIVELVKEGVGLSVLARWSVAPHIDRGELVARPLTAAGRFRHWSAAWRAKPAPPPYLLGFVDVLARNPLPLGRTSSERRRIASVVVSPGARRRA